MNVLLSCAGRRHYLATYFSQGLGSAGWVIGTDMSLSAPALHACHVAVKVPGVFANNYLSSLIEVIRNKKINMMFSLNDLEVGLLSENRMQIEQETGVTLYVPPTETLNICADKWQTYRFARDIGINTPATFLHPEDAEAAVAAGEVSFPLIVKPRWGSASIGLFIVHSSEELEAGFQQCRQAVSKSALAVLGSESSVIIQEVIQGPEYGVDLLYGKNQNFLGFTAKKKLAMRAGETDKAVTVAPELFAELVAKIAAVLPHRGNLDCDFLERDGQFYLLEFNPRFGGGYPFTHLAGANHVQMLIDDYQGRPLAPYGYQVGKAFAKCDTLVEVPVE